MALITAWQNKGEIMAVKETKQTEQDLNEEVMDVEAKKAQALSAILPTLDLPEDVDPEEELQEIRDEEEREKRGKQKDGQKKLHKKEVKNEDESEEEEEEGVDDQEEEETDEELIPKSKVDKRFKQLTAKIKALEAKEARAPQQMPVGDADTARLANMSPDQLQSTLKDVRMKSLTIASSDDDAERAKLGDYVDLESKIHKAINTYPQRFYNEQVLELNDVVESVSYDEDIEDSEVALPEIKKIAESIYAKHPNMRTLKSGMRQAYELAVEKYKIVQTGAEGKSESKRVKRENVRLKRKTTLDTSKIKGKPSSKKLELLREKIKRNATDTDRADFVKESPIFNVDELLPDEFKT